MGWIYEKYTRLIASMVFIGKIIIGYFCCIYIVQVETQLQIKFQFVE